MQYRIVDTFTEIVGRLTGEDWQAVKAIPFSTCTLVAEGRNPTPNSRHAVDSAEAAISRDSRMFVRPQF